MRGTFFRLAVVGFAAAILSASCGEDEKQTPEPVAKPDASLPGPDAGACVRRCDGRMCGSDGCGGICGTCAAGMTCNQATGQCGAACVAESNEEFCVRIEKNCGSVTSKDNCGVDRTWNCGTCLSPATCDLLTHRCVGEPCRGETDAELCSSANRRCGSYTGVDRCNQSRTVANCGSCGANEKCEAATGQCVSCTPESDTAFCQRLQKNCGSVTDLDSCGQLRTAPCGSCTSPKVCGDDNVCAAPGAPTNDSCTSPIALTQGVQVTGDTTLATPDYGETGLSATCMAKFTDGYSSWTAGGRELVYTYTPTAAGSFTITLTPTSSGFDPLIWVTEGSCGTASACKDGADDGLDGDAETLLVTGTAGATYYIYVDSGYDTADPSGYGPFTLLVQ